MKNQFKEYFELAEKTLSESKILLNIIDENFSSYDKGAKRLCITLFIQCTRLLGAVLTLCNNGYDEEASILVRTLLENCSYLLFIGEKEHEERAVFYMNSRALSDAEAVLEANSIAPEGELKVDEGFYLKRKHEALTYLRNKLGSDKDEKELKRGALRARNAAEQLQQSDKKEYLITTYKILHRPASSVTHGEAPLRFITEGEQGIIFKKSASGKQSKICLQTSVLLTCYEMETIIRLLKIEIDNEAISIIEKLKSLLINPC